MTSKASQRVVDGFYGQGFMATLGAELLQAGGGTCNVKMPFSEAVTQQHGFFHGGVVATLADSAAGFAAFALMDEHQQPLTVEFKINLLAPAIGDALVARAKVERHGRSIHHVRSDVYAITGETEVLIAMAIVTIKATTIKRQP